MSTQADPAPSDDRFLEMLEERETLLVYADWLEERGETARAEVLRLQYKLVSGAGGDDRGEIAARMLEIGANLDPAWRRAISRPSVAGSTWTGRSDKNPFIVRFLADGVVNYHYGAGSTSYQNATWLQVGCAVGIETNRHYADYEGAIDATGELLAGIAHNITGARWAWSVARTTDPALVRIPDNVVTTVFTHTTPAAPAKRERRRVPAAKKGSAKAKAKAKTAPKAQAKARPAPKAKPKAKARPPAKSTKKKPSRK
ncbi:MAG: TIGR02996 domain-containing protein [Deltaproteobacteria bacterium]|nr:TIGR02996 domain-containing protein [Deltaproteobacteria bacterium]